MDAAGGRARLSRAKISLSTRGQIARRPDWGQRARDRVGHGNVDDRVERVMVIDRRLTSMPAVGVSAARISPLGDLSGRFVVKAQSADLGRRGARQLGRQLIKTRSGGVVESCPHAIAAQDGVKTACKYGDYRTCKIITESSCNQLSNITDRKL